MSETVQSTDQSGQSNQSGRRAAVQVRSLSFADLPSVLAIERRSFPAPWSLAMFVLELSKSGGVCLAATLEGKLVGYLICSPYADVLHLMNVAIDPDRRRGGVASALVTEMLDQAGRDRSYTLEVRVSNDAAIKMYEGFGFRRAGHRRRYYHDNGEDALIMWLGEAIGVPIQ